MTKQIAQANALNLSLEEFRALAEISPGVHYICEAFGEFATKFIASGVKSQFDYDADQFTDDPAFWANNIHPEDKTRVFDKLGALFELGAHSHEYRFLHNDGEYRWVSDEFKLLCNKSGEPEKIVGKWIDVTEKKRTEDAFVRSEERHRRMIESMKDGIGEIAADGTIIYANERTCEIFRLPHDELLGLPITDFLDEENRKILADQVERRSQGQTNSYEIMWTRRDSSTFWTQSSPMPLTGDDGGFLGSFAVMTDITETKKTETRLLESEERFRNLAEGSIQGILVHLGDFRPVFVNDAYARMFGYESPKEIISLESLFDLIAPHERERIEGYSTARKRGDGTPVRFEYEGRKRDGSAVWLEDFVSLIDWQGEPAIQSTLVDITERKMLEEQVRRSQKMEAVGQLTGGIAHDFNNLMAIMTGNLELALEQVEPDTPLRNNIENALEAVGRGVTLTQQLLSFSRRQALSPAVTDVKQLVGGTLTFLDRTLGENIRIVTKYVSEDILVNIDPAVFDNALVNIALNARDAMPDGGTLTVRTATIELAGETIGLDEEPTFGHHALITVTDTGSGISQDDLRQVLEPFFTTKDVGKGSGLGLSMVYGFVAQSNGHMNIASKEGEGTTISLYFPISDEELVDKDNEAAPFPEVNTDKTILLVEDHQQVREATSATLIDLGYKVIEAEDGPSALEILNQRSSDIDLVFSDVVMPNGMSGIDLVKQIVVDHKHINALLTSGYPDKIADDNDIKALGIKLLAKPFRRAQLAAAIENAASGQTKH